MKNRLSRGLALLALLACALTARAATLSANFDSLVPGGTGPFNQNGIQFSAGSIITGPQAGAMFNTGFSYVGNALLGGTPITVPGQAMFGASMTYGFDWNFYTIAYGLMDVTINWSVSLAGVQGVTGNLFFGRYANNHGGGLLNISVPSGFDSLTLWTTAREYAQAAATGDGYQYGRGAVVGNYTGSLAIDNLTVTTGVVPDLGGTLALFALGSAGLGAFARHRRVRVLA